MHAPPLSVGRHRDGVGDRHGAGHGPRVRVERKHGHREPADRTLLDPLGHLRAVDPGVDVLRHTVQGPHGHLVRPRCARNEERVGGVGGAVGARATERIVKLGKEHPFPRLGQLAAYVGRVPGEQAAYLVEGLGGDEGILCPPVRELEVGSGRVAADGMPLQLPVHHREDVAHRAPERVEVGDRVAEVDRAVELVRQGVDRAHGEPGRPPTVVPDPEEGHEGDPERPALRQELVGPPPDELVLGAPGGVVAGDPVRRQLGAVGSPPAEDGGGDFLLIRPRAHEDVGADPGRGKKLGEGA